MRFVTRSSAHDPTLIPAFSLSLAISSTALAASAVQPVWCEAPTPRPVSPWVDRLPRSFVLIFERLLESCVFRREGTATDPKGWFGVHLARVAG